jgi:alpha-beta hydrolase superfamily lysophospholipase
MEHIQLYSTGGLRLAGDFYSPAPADGVAPAAGPAVLFALGFGSVKGQVRSWADRLVAAGFCVLVLDYRGFGDSEGTRGRVVPQEQVEDLRAGLTYLAHREEVDPHRIALLGVSTGGAVAVYTAGVDPRVTAVCSIVGWADGARHLRYLRRHHEWLDLLDRVDAARTRRVVDGVDDRVDPDEILLRDPESTRWRRQMVEQFPDMGFDTTMETAERILEFRPESMLPLASGAPLLVIHAEHDQLVPVDEAWALYRRASEPKRIVIIPDAEHHDVHQGSAFETCIEEVTGWLRTHLDTGAGAGSATSWPTSHHIAQVGGVRRPAAVSGSS